MNRVERTFRIAVVSAMLAGCTPGPTQPPIGGTDMPGGTNPAHTLTVEPPTQLPIEGTPEPTSTVITGPGPESTGVPDAQVLLPFPSEISLEQATSGLSQDISLPAIFRTDGQLMNEINTTIAIHKNWCNLDAPCTGTLQAVYSQADHRWTTAALDGQGNVTEWMFIHTDMGDHWAEQPFWDSTLTGKTTAEINNMITDGDIEFTLPPNTVSGSHFELLWQNGFPIMVEVDKDGKPFQWNTLDGGMKAIVGAEVPTPEFTMGLPATVEECNQVTWDQSKMEQFMLDHTQAVLDYADQQGWTADTVSPINLWMNGDFFQDTNTLPHPFLNTQMTNPNIADCMEMTMPDGNSMLVLSVVTKIRNVENATRTVLHFVFDPKGEENFLTARGSDYFSSAQDILDNINSIRAEGKRLIFETQVWIPMENKDNLQLLQSQWPNTEIVEKFNERFGSIQIGRPTESEIPEVAVPIVLNIYLRLSIWDQADPHHAPSFLLEDELAEKFQSILIPVKDIYIEAGR